MNERLLGVLDSHDVNLVTHETYYHQYSKNGAPTPSFRCQQLRSLVLDICSLRGDERRVRERHGQRERGLSRYVRL